ncbi:MAG: AAA family ATPase [Proteobacteria bacterium]|nr:AAA family ATPase [Pseudomonadota bacterium]
MLIVLAGLPGTGKTTLGRTLAARLHAAYLRIDVIEQALRDAGGGGPGAPQDVGACGYRVAYALAGSNLSLGRPVVADCVNPLGATRAAWHAVAAQAGVAVVDVELVCSDAAEHRRRVEQRSADIAGFTLPTWADVMARDYAAWATDRLVIDTAHRSTDESLAHIEAHLARRGARG